MKRIRSAVRTLINREKPPPDPPLGPDPWRKNWGKRKSQLLSSNARPEPLPSRRLRSLIPDDINEDFEMTHHDQDQSLLFSRLPIDVRRLIYQEVLASPEQNELHIISSNKRLMCHRCHFNDPEIPSWAHARCWGSAAVDGTSIDWMEDGLGPSQVGLKFKVPAVMGLLCSCRRIYSECIDLLYSENTLNFRQTRTVVDLKATILPQRFQNIRSLHLACPLEASWEAISQSQEKELYGSPAWYPGDACFYWKPAWDVIRSMKGLKNLRVSLWQFERLNCEDLLITDDKVIELFRSIVGVEVPNFHVEFFWPVNVQELQHAFNGKLRCSLEVKKIPSHDKYVLPVYTKNVRCPTSLY